MKMEELKKKLKKIIFDLGFDVLGFSKPYVEKKTRRQYLNFLNKNFHGDMKWLERHYQKKINPKKIWDQVETILVLGLNYAPPSNPISNNYLKNKANISVYAHNQDYHIIIKEKLKKIQSWLIENQNIDSRYFVDSSPILEKYFAEKANLGWQGKHTNIVSKKFGSWLFLAELFLPVKIYDLYNKVDGCGTCVKCLDVCPTKALLGNNQIDSKKCISYLTIEHRGPFPRSLRKKIGNKVYGCDDCLSVCPWNKFSKETNEKKLQAVNSNKNLSFFLNFNEEDFKKYFYKSPIKRIGWIRFLRNIIIACGNSNDKKLIKYLYKYIDHESSLIRGSCLWSLFQLESEKELKKVKKLILKKEKNNYVLNELRSFG